MVAVVIGADLAGSGWRIVAFDRSFHGANSVDMRLSGPTAGVGFLF